jgi:hypothetical protein
MKTWSSGHVKNTTLLKSSFSLIEIHVPCLTFHDTCPKAYLLPSWKNRPQFIVQNLAKNEECSDFENVRKTKLSFVLTFDMFFKMGL